MCDCAAKLEQIEQRVAVLETKRMRTRKAAQQADFVADPATVDEIVARWNEIPGVLKSKAVIGPIKQRLLARLREHPDLLWWTTYFDRIKDSEFLTGRKTDFAATLDWVLGPNNMAKILSGNYDGRPQAQPKAQVKVEPRPVHRQEYSPPPPEVMALLSRIGKGM